MLLKCLRLLKKLTYLIPRVSRTSWPGGCLRNPLRSWWWWPSRGRWACCRTWCRARPSPRHRPGTKPVMLTVELHSLWHSPGRRRWASPWWPPASAAPAPCSWHVTDVSDISNLETWKLGTLIIPLYLLLHQAAWEFCTLPDSVLPSFLYTALCCGDNTTHICNTAKGVT